MIILQFFKLIGISWLIYHLLFRKSRVWDLPQKIWYNSSCILSLFSGKLSSSVRQANFKNPHAFNAIFRLLICFWLESEVWRWTVYISYFFLQSFMHFEVFFSYWLSISIFRFYLGLYKMSTWPFGCVCYCDFFRENN